MNKSLLAVMAIMPTLLVGCKDKELKEIVVEPNEISLKEAGHAVEVLVCPKPSIALDNDQVEWIGVSDKFFHFKYKENINPAKPGSLTYDVSYSGIPETGTYKATCVYQKTFKSVLMITVRNSKI